MIPNNKWFPSSLAERADWYLNFDTQLQIVGPSLGMTAPDLADLAKDNQNIQFLALAAQSIESYSDAARQYRKIFTEGDIGDPKPDFPADPGLTLPNPSQPTGAFERLDGLVKRIRVAPTYTNEIGALLGIIPQQSEGFAPETAKPEITVETQPDNLINVKFVRGGSSGIRVEIGIDKGPWVSQGNFVKSPVALIIEQSVNNLPRLVAVRARYLDGNSPVGDWSNIVTVQTIP